MATRGIGSLVEQANAGDTRAMCELGGCYHNGTRGVSKNLDEALRWYSKARNAEGLYSVGCECYYGTLSEPARDVAKAVSAWTMAAGLSHCDAMAQLGLCYQRGVGVEPDHRRAVSLYRAAALAQHRRHSWRLGVCYLRGEGVKRDWAMAAQLFQKSDTNSDAQAYLGWCYLWGVWGAAKDVAQAAKLLEAAAGVWCSAQAQVFLGYCHERGIGVGLDAGKALELFSDATRGGGQALGELGEYCQRGDCGAPIDKRAAVGYFRMGAEGGDPVSMFHLGVCLRDGDGVDSDVEQSQNWLVKAAVLGHRGAEKVLSSYPVSNSGKTNSVVQQQVTTVEILEKEVESLKKQLVEERAHSQEQVDTLKKQLADEQTVAENLRKQLTDEVERIKMEKEQLVNRVKETETALRQQHTNAENLTKALTEEVERYKTIVNTMTSLISATIDDFEVVKLLGTGSNAAAFKVQYRGTTFITNSSNNNQISATSTASPSPSSPSLRRTTTDMVMKVLFNWENTPRQTMVRQKYMVECIALALVPNHPNVIHPLAALVIPWLPAPFADKIPREQSAFRELGRNKSLAILMPHCGITLSSFLLSFSSNKSTLEVENLFVQGLKAIFHIETHFVVHRDIKGDNILVDPETCKLTLIDFGEAQNCPNMEMTLTTTSQAWGNTGTMPPELGKFLKGIMRGTGAVFSYSKCDSFALALTFWNALLPPEHKFIGNHDMSRDMSLFNTQSLLCDFPIPLFSSASSQQARAAALQAAQPTPTATKRRRQNNSSNGEPVLLESVMMEMMNPEKATRLSAADALQALTS
ncbi:sel1 repeat family protein [Pelomyxa schiedti]|nr:sel1 repeat family protein [Pelomyxa schiedti]